MTTDGNLSYQQNLSGRAIAIVVPSSTRWPWIRAVTDAVAKAVAGCAPGTYVEVAIPPR